MPYTQQQRIASSTSMAGGQTLILAINFTYINKFTQNYNLIAPQVKSRGKSGIIKSIIFLFFRAGTADVVLAVVTYGTTLPATVQPARLQTTNLPFHPVNHQTRNMVTGRAGHLRDSGLPRHVKKGKPISS